MRAPSRSLRSRTARPARRSLSRQERVVPQTLSVFPCRTSRTPARKTSSLSTVPTSSSSARISVFTCTDATGVGGDALGHAVLNDASSRRAVSIAKRCLARVTAGISGLNGSVAPRTQRATAPGNGSKAFALRHTDSHRWNREQNRFIGGRRQVGLGPRPDQRCVGEKLHRRQGRSQPSHRLAAHDHRVSGQEIPGLTSTPSRSIGLTPSHKSAVSTSRSGQGSWSITTSTASRVVPSSSLMITRASPTRASKSEDFPAFGGPASTTAAPSRPGIAAGNHGRELVELPNDRIRCGRSSQSRSAGRPSDFVNSSSATEPAHWRSTTVAAVQPGSARHSTDSTPPPD